MRASSSGHQFVVVFHVLRDGNVEHRTSGLAESEARELGVAHDADDAEGAGEFGEVETEMLIDGIFIALEESFDEGLVHDGDRGGGFVIGFGEMAAAEATGRRDSAGSWRRRGPTRRPALR